MRVCQKTVAWVLMVALAGLVYAGRAQTPVQQPATPAPGPAGSQGSTGRIDPFGPGAVLKDGDITRMVERGVPDGQIILIISRHKNQFVLPNGAVLLAAHNTDHISSVVLRAMADATGTPQAKQAYVDYLQLLQSPTSQPPAATVSAPKGKGLTAQDVYDMLAQHVPESTIRHLIDSQPVNFQLFTTADFDEAAKQNVPEGLLTMMVQAAGPRAVTAQQQYKVDVQNRQIAAAKAHRDHIAWLRAEIRKQCPGCVSIFFYEYDADHKSFIPNALPEGVRKAVAPYAELKYAAAHHIFLAAESEAADYQVVWSEHDNAVTFHQSHMDTTYTTSGDTVFVTHDEPYTRESAYYNFRVAPLDGKESEPILYQVHMQNAGMFIGRNHPDVDCWHDVEKFLQKRAAEQR